MNSNTQYPGITFKDLIKLVVSLAGSGMLSFTLFFMFLARMPDHPTFGLVFSCFIGALLVVDAMMESIDRDLERAKRNTENQ